MANRGCLFGAIFLGAMLSFGCSDDTAGVPDGSTQHDQGLIADAAVIDDSTRPACEGSEQLFYPGCEPADLFVTISEGCYQTCSGANDMSCPSDAACRTAWINPCVCEPGATCCAACGAEQWLCLSNAIPYPLEDINASCDDTLTAKQVLDGLQSPYAATLLYANDAETALTLGLAYEGGTILCHPEILAPPGSLAPDYPARIEMQVALTLKTDDGFFDESFATALDGQIGWANFSHEMQISALGGSYTPTNDHTKVTFQATFTGTTAQGTISTRGDSGIGPNLGSWAIP
ncbi:MAG: hypothetical protein JRH20_25775 [Deltaproteobacteria bacterium]|nr:hypothetical protein [Deltaproteobacteria bacterium]